MEDKVLTVLENACIAKDVYRMKLSGDTGAVTKPGQFVNIRVPGFYLRRPISVCDWDVSGKGELTLIYKIVGKGTDRMSAFESGDKLDVLTGLGNGFETENAGDAPLVVGGGVGTPPMYGLAKRLVRAGHPVNVILGFASKEDSFYAEEFEALNDLYDFGCEGFEGERPEVRVYISTVDGSIGTKGFVTDCLENIARCSHYYACGPIPMLKALKAAMSEKFPEISGELSLEERMGCGFGACVGCSLMTANGAKKVCSDGPVFKSCEVL